MNLFKKVYGLLLGIIGCVVVYQLAGAGLYFGVFINRFYPCTDCPGCSFPCYGNYDICIIVLALAVGIVLIGVLIFKVIKFFRNKSSKLRGPG